jgi:hypothetical protein
MPANKDFKRLVRSRMRKTGESYTAARATLIEKQPARGAARTAPAATPAAVDYARLAGMSDAVLKAKTGCTWARWVPALDHVQAYQWPHGEIAAFVHEKYGIPGWWAQAVTVGYERIKGLRAKGQSRSGTWEAGRSKTFPVGVRRLYRAFRDRRQRARWLGDVALVVRTAIAGKSMRVTWPDGSSVELYFVGKGGSKSQVSVQHRKLPDQAAVARSKAFWGERLEALGAELAGS